LFNHFVKCLQVTKIKLRGKTLSVCDNNEEKKKHRIKERNDNEMLRFTLPPEENKKHRTKKRNVNEMLRFTLPPEENKKHRTKKRNADPVILAAGMTV